MPANNYSPNQGGYTIDFFSREKFLIITRLVK